MMHMGQNSPNTRIFPPLTQQKRAVYATAIAGNDVDEPNDPVDDAGYTSY
jgi:hypothetical protein